MISKMENVRGQMANALGISKINHICENLRILSAQSAGKK